MRGSLGKAVVSVSVILSIVTIGGLIEARTDELLTNGSFESGTTDGWIAAGGTLQAVCGSAPVAEGNCAGLLVTDAELSGVVQHELLPVQPGGSYTLEGFILKDDPQVASVTLSITCRGLSGEPLDPGCRLTEQLTLNSSDYHPLSIGPFQAPSNAAFALISVTVLSDSPGAQIYIDDVRFEGPSPPSPTPTTYEPLPTDTATPMPTTTPTPLPTSTPTLSPTSTTVPTPTPPGMATGYLLNSGFEEAIDGAPVAWSKYGGGLEQTATRHRSGNHAAAFSSDTASTKWAFQPIRVESDKAYLFDGYVLLNDPGVGEVFLRISWYASSDASGPSVAVSDSTERLSGT